LYVDVVSHTRGSFLGFFFLNNVMSESEEVSMMKVALASHTLVETKEENTRAIQSLTRWAKHYVGDLSMLQGWGAAEVVLVLAYLVKYHKQVHRFAEELKVEKKVEDVLQIREQYTSGGHTAGRKGSWFRMADRMEEFVENVAGMVDGVQAVRELAMMFKDVAERVGRKVVRMTTERASEEGSRGHKKRCSKRIKRGLLLQ
jgi:hypothetical protein